jgi:SPW repeat
MATYDDNRYRRALQSNHWQDWANLVLAVWLFISPWVVQFGGSTVGAPAATAVPAAASNAAWNAWILGIVVFLVACSAIARLRAWQEWLNLLLGIWIFIAPWALGFAGLSGAAWDHWIVGILVFLIAVANLQTVRGAATVPPAADRVGTGTAASEPGYAGSKPMRRP